MVHILTCVLVIFIFNVKKKKNTNQIERHQQCNTLCPNELRSAGKTMHNICKVRNSNPATIKKNTTT